MSPLPNVTIELIPDLEQGGFTAHIPDIPAYGEGETEEEAIDDLKWVCRLSSRRTAWRLLWRASTLLRSCGK